MQLLLSLSLSLRLFPRETRGVVEMGVRECRGLDFRVKGTGVLGGSGVGVADVCHLNAVEDARRQMPF